MDTHSVQTAPILDESPKRNHKKLTKREKKLAKKKRKFLKKHGTKKHYFEPIDKKNCITLHLVHRSTNDPLLDIPDNENQLSEWVLEPEIKTRNDFERVQNFFGKYELEDTIPHHYRTDEFIEKTSAKSMPILQLKSRNTNPNNYDYSKHYRPINDSNFIPQGNKNNKDKNSEVLEEYIFEQEYENENEYDPDAYDSNGNNICTDPNYKDYIGLLESDNEDEKYETYEYNSDEKMTGDLQDDFVFKAMGLNGQSTNNERVTIADFEPHGARFAKWNEMDIHYDKYYNNDNYTGKSESLYDKTITHLKNIQNAKDSNLNNLSVNYLEDISEENEQFMDAEEDESVSDWSNENESGIAYDPNMSLLDNQFEIMLNGQYCDEYIGELDDDLDELRGEFNVDIAARFRGKDKKKSLRYKYYMYLKNKKRRIRRRLKKANREVTLQLMGVDVDGKENENDGGNESDEIIFFSDSDSGNDEKLDDINYKDLDSDDERRINAEIDEEFKKKEPEKWDVESILSTRTNHENHPMEIKVNIGGNVKKNLEDIMEDSDSKMDGSESDNGSGNGLNGMEFNFGAIGNEFDGIVKEENDKGIVFEFKQFDEDIKCENDMNDLNGNENEMNEVNENGKDVNGNVVAYGKRKGESKEEKRLRKKLQKEMKQKRRKEKKLNRDAFKQARKKQTKLNVTQRKSHGNAVRL